MTGFIYSRDGSTRYRVEISVQSFTMRGSDKVVYDSRIRMYRAGKRGGCGQRWGEKPLNRRFNTEKEALDAALKHVHTHRERAIIENY